MSKSAIISFASAGVITAFLIGKLFPPALVGPFAALDVLLIIAVLKEVIA